jgi:response regulator of citrate/malate metabolism
MNQEELKRQQAKTSEQRFLTLMQQDFQCAPKVAQAILEEAKSCLISAADNSLRVGQVRVILLKRNAPHGQALKDTASTEVTWTVDAGAEDIQVAKEQGRQGLRRVRITRLVEEALAQGAVATQEDLARVLHVSVRTIKRDCAVLQTKGVTLPMRGNLKGIGRGQTHKAQIIQHWLQGETYDQLNQRTRHSISAIRRYIQTFVRVAQLHQQGFVHEEISLLLQLGDQLVQTYLALYEHTDSSFSRQRLQEELQRLQQPPLQQKKGGVL